MKNFLSVLVLLICWGCQNAGLEELSYSEYRALIMSQEIPDLNAITIKDEYGHQISVDSMMSLHQAGEYFDRFFKNTEGQVVAYQLAPKPAFRDLPISCDRTRPILDSIYLIDQQVRQNNYDPRQDYANMEMVSNIMDKCGMPNSPAAVHAAFMVVQHNHNVHQKQYIEDFRTAANAGLLSKSSLALMEDRILTHEGEPQLYGTQVRRRANEDKWELFELADPARVDQRRAKMGLGPLKDYLQNNYGIEFLVEQMEE